MGCNVQLNAVLIIRTTEMNETTETVPLGNHDVRVSFNGTQ